jgi:multiple sugar transport system ATP-binding protein
MNMIEATVTSSNGGLALDVGKQHLRLDEATLQAHPALRAYDGRAVILGIRPEDLEDASLEPGSPPDRRLRGMVELREALGSELIVHFTVEGTREALTEDVKELAHDAGVP